MTKDEILQDLKKKIMEGDIPQGHWLVERELSSHYGVSRTPIREVLMRLVLDGLIVQLPSRGFFVKELDVQEVFEIFQAREAIEGMASRLAALRREADIIDSLIELRYELEKVDIKKDSAEGVQLGRLLHGLIIDASGNRLLKELYARVSNLAFLTSNLTVKNYDIEADSKRLHLEIIGAIIEGDYDASERLMKQHLSITCRNLVNTLYPGFLLSELNINSDIKP